MIEHDCFTKHSYSCMFRLRWVIIRVALEQITSSTRVARPH